MAILDQNHGLTPLEKCQFFEFWASCFYSLEKRFFVLEYRKRHFAGLYWKKKKLEKWPLLDQKGWVNLFGQMSIFRLFEFLVFIA